MCGSRDLGRPWALKRNQECWNTKRFRKKKYVRANNSMRKIWQPQTLGWLGLVRHTCNVHICSEWEGYSFQTVIPQTVFATPLVPDKNGTDLYGAELFGHFRWIDGKEFSPFFGENTEDFFVIKNESVLLEGEVAKILRRRIQAELDHKKRGRAIRPFTVGDRVSSMNPSKIKTDEKIQNI